MKVKSDVFFWILLSSVIVLPACGEETVNITTFYPTPCGVYKNLKSEVMAIGEKESADLPSEKGVLMSQPRSEPSEGEEGDLYFDAPGIQFKYYDGSSWRTLGSGTVGNCDWFRNECPVGWESPGPGEEYHRQIENDDLPVVGPEYKYVWRQHNSNMNQGYVCESRNIDFDNPPDDFISSPVKERHDYNYRFCRDCFGNGCTGYEKVYNSSGNQVTILVIVGSAIYRVYLYRCIYPGGPEDVEIAGTYDMRYCCPPE